MGKDKHHGARTMRKDRPVIELCAGVFICIFIVFLVSGGSVLFFFGTDLRPCGVALALFAVPFGVIASGAACWASFERLYSRRDR